MRYFPLLLGAAFLLLVLFSAAQLADGSVQPHPSLGRTGSVLALLTVAAFGASLVGRALPARVSPRTTQSLRIAAFAGLAALLLRAGFDAAAFSVGDRVVLLFLGGLIALLAVLLVYWLVRDSA